MWKSTSFFAAKVRIAGMPLSVLARGIAATMETAENKSGVPFFAALPLAFLFAALGTGYLYGGLIAAVIFKLLQEFFSSMTPQSWQFWIGLVLVVIVLLGQQPHCWMPMLSTQHVKFRSINLKTTSLLEQDPSAQNRLP
jgi:hypothetical protein